MVISTTLAPLATAAMVWIVFSAQVQAQAITETELINRIAELHAQLANLQKLIAEKEQDKIVEITHDLTIGSRSNEVYSLQRFLSDNGYLNVAPTGYFGKLTLNAVSLWQKDQGIIPAHGYLGPKSRAKLKFMIMMGRPLPLEPR